MMVFTAKLKKRTFLIPLLILAAILLILLLPGQQDPVPEVSAPAQQEQPVQRANSNEERLTILRELGWQTEEQPTQTQEVRIPEDPDEVFLRYNELQKSQGFDLSEYAGKNVKRYVYRITNYPGGEGDYFATLLVCRGDLIGGDVASSAPGGVMHSLAFPR